MKPALMTTTHGVPPALTAMVTTQPGNTVDMETPMRTTVSTHSPTLESPTPPALMRAALAGAPHLCMPTLISITPGNTVMRMTTTMAMTILDQEVDQDQALDQEVDMDLTMMTQLPRQ